MILFQSGDFQIVNLCPIYCPEKCAYKVTGKPFSSNIFLASLNSLMILIEKS